MIEAVEFQNFKVLRQARLPLGPLTLIVGPNGSGKSTAIQGLRALAGILQGVQIINLVRCVSIGVGRNSRIEIRVQWGSDVGQETTRLSASAEGINLSTSTGQPPSVVASEQLVGLRHFALDPQALAAPVPLHPRMELEANGTNLAGVLDRLRDEQPERFDALNAELARWLPEFDRVLFETPLQGQRAFGLRVGKSQQSIPAASLSEGTLLAVALLTLAHLAEPPTILTIEEPDRGIHPRLLRDVQDALYRLAFPTNFGESRKPVQVIATSHSPYFLDLFRDHPEQVVIAQKNGLEATFERLSDRPDIDEILGSAPLGEAWYSGILGGVPAGT